MIDVVIGFIGHVCNNCGCNALMVKEERFGNNEGLRLICPICSLESPLYGMPAPLVHLVCLSIPEPFDVTTGIGISPQVDSRVFH